MSSQPQSAKQARITAFLKSQNRTGQQQGPKPPAPEIVEKQRASVSSTGVSSAQSTRTVGDTLDIFDYLSSGTIDEDAKFNLLCRHWSPDASFTFPKVLRRLPSGKSKMQSFQRSWLDRFPWLVYSPRSDGGFCLPCALFAAETAGGIRLSTLIRSPLTNLNDATRICMKHAETGYHSLSLVRAADFKAVRTSIRGNVVQQSNSTHAQTVKKNRQALSSLVECLKFCGRQNLPLRGHDDSGPLTDPENFETAKNEGNFRAVVRFRVASGDRELLSFIKNAPRNALYLSPQIQNEVLICGTMIRDCLVSMVNQSIYFSVLADETTDASHEEQLSICVRFVAEENGLHGIQENFLGFVNAPVLSGEALSNLLMETLESWGVKLAGLRGQGYDGASNMAGKFRGVQALILQKYPKAFYTHCCSHCLNLVLINGSKVPPIRKIMKNLSDTLNFFTSSPKRLVALKGAIAVLLPTASHTRLKFLCETRWILGELRDDSEFSTAHKAENIDMRVRSLQFIVGIRIVELVLNLTLPLSVALQAKNMNLPKCAELVSNIIEVFQEIRRKSKDKITTLFNEAKDFANQFGARVAVRGVGTDDNQLKDHFHEAYLCPFLDSVVGQLKERFTPLFKKAAKCNILMPMSLQHHFPFLGLLSDCPTKDFNDILDVYEEDVSSRGCALAEMRIWHNKWKGKDGSIVPSTFPDIMRAVADTMLPNVKILLQIFWTLPVTTASAERSFSQLRRLKTYLRNTTKEERLTSLALMNAHRDVPLPTDEIVRIFAETKYRKLDILL
ncbi:52 kDa repressor of the inhibitor of the protein kinase-like [Ciona intestinalis]